MVKMLPPFSEEAFENEERRKKRIWMDGWMDEHSKE
jgi:hypothetical protein